MESTRLLLEAMRRRRKRRAMLVRAVANVIVAGSAGLITSGLGAPTWAAVGFALTVAWSS